MFVCVGLGWKLGGCLCVLGQVGSYVALIKCCSCLGPPPPAPQSLWWFSGVCVCWARLEVGWLFVCVGPGWKLCGFD